ncbi:phosphatase PAP2 family protein [Halobiforma nitratireducens]|uniref:PA-phosphatase-like phosphoesterase n=1 Tax=Halobiforma nitratireducens JCM 10879 TaxID=1227454 RepID=M0LT22_9EURY|nr:phosphatase PAP2 family protein [Halobiforma nitratireducens]EMA36313.1 PA-phosphatase-like phosphoesterase [Halobiforma nitratireducens JCM 10879]
MWFDPSHVETVRDAFPEWMAFLFAFVSYLGSVWVVAPAVVLAYWFWDRHRFAAWIGTVMGGYAVMVGLKNVFAIPRPGVGPAISPDALPTVLAFLYAPAVEVHTMAFPSGHALAGTIVWTMLALESDLGTRRQRLAAAATVITLVGFSRVGVGVHYPIDVVAGVAVGVAYLAGVLWLRGRVAGRVTAGPCHRPRRAVTDSSARPGGPAKVSRTDHGVRPPQCRAATATFAVAAALAAIAFAISETPDAAALFGGAVGAFLAWQYATPAAEPWPLSAPYVGRALFGVSALALVALVLVVTDAVFAWLFVGLAGGLLVLALPRLTSSRAVFDGSNESTRLT